MQIYFIVLVLVLLQMHVQYIFEIIQNLIYIFYLGYLCKIFFLVITYKTWTYKNVLL